MDAPIHSTWKESETAKVAKNFKVTKRRKVGLRIDVQRWNWKQKLVQNTTIWRQQQVEPTQETPNPELIGEPAIQKSSQSNRSRESKKVRKANWPERPTSTALWTNSRGQLLHRRVGNSAFATRTRTTCTTLAQIRMSGTICFTTILTRTSLPT